MVQWLGHWASNAGDMGSIPGWGTEKKNEGALSGIMLT